ncbi:MAG: RICIN domain-containing protein [Nostoc sp. DedQUE12a]|nr:RICIN domain-containing protein [Nostoc sp. DedQUE12a]
MVATPVQQSQTISVTYGTDGSKIVSGSTTPGATKWEKSGDDGIYVTIDTSAAKFTKTPIYVTSLVGPRSQEQWGITGASSVYEPTTTSFFVAVRWDKDFKTEILTPEIANSKKWYINWIAIEPAQETSTQTSSTTTRPNQLPNLGCENEKQLRSASGTTPATQIKFVNETASLVKVYWVKADGQRQFFKDLKSGESFTQSTFVDHVWVVTDEKGGCLGIYKGEKDPKDAIIEGSKTAFPTPGKDYYLISKHSGKPIAVDGASTANAAKIVQWDNQKVDHFKFQLQDAGDGYYYIVAKHSGRGFAVNGVSKDNGANVVQWDKVAQDNHKFKLQDAGEGYFYIIPKHSGKTLAVYGLTKDNGANIVQWDLVNQDNHKWKFEAV